MLQGKKTYLVSAAMIAYAVLGVVLGYHGTDRAIELALTALGMGALRNGMTTKKR